MKKFKNVGADASVRPTSKARQNKGITLIALIITIIVMLILVAVTINMAINGGLFEKAGEAVGDTKNEINKEQELADGRIQVDGKWYNSIDDYLSGKYEGYVPTYDEASKDETSGILKENATYTSGEYTAVIPKGFKIIEGINGTTTIADGLVIQDRSGNEFVWIPVTEDLGESYSYSSGYSEPTELTTNYSSSGAAYDSQATLEYLYGDKYNYEDDFKYVDEYAKMVKSVNENNGFYIGRYETTIDTDGSIGSKYNTTVLTSATTYTYNSTTYYYRSYGLYYASKNANVTGNGSSVQTAMIYGVLYDKAMEFIRTQKEAGKTTYNVDSATFSWHNGSSVVKSGQLNPGATGDVALNIWDLESNAREWTQEAVSPDGRVIRGGACIYSNYASYRDTGNPASNGTFNSSRLALYIK